MSGDVARDQVCREGQSQSGQAGRLGRRTGRQRETYTIAESDLERLDDGEAITGWTDSWLRGQLAQLEAVHEDFDRALEGENWRSRHPSSLRGLSPVDS